MKWLLRIVLLILALLVTAFLIFRTPDTDPAEMRAKYGGEPSQFVEIGDGVTVHLRDEGPKDAPAIILLHGSNADLHAPARAIMDAGTPSCPPARRPLDPLGETRELPGQHFISGSPA